MINQTVSLLMILSDIYSSLTKFNHRCITDERLRPTLLKMHLLDIVYIHYAWLSYAQRLVQYSKLLGTSHVVSCQRFSTVIPAGPGHVPPVPA